MILPDTSVWISFLRPGANDLTAEMVAYLDQHDVLICGPVAAELVAGARPQDRAELIGAIAGLPWAELDRTAWHNVGLLAAELRDKGQTLPLTDLEIAIAAHANAAELWTRDQHFHRIDPLLDGLSIRFLG